MAGSLYLYIDKNKKDSSSLKITDKFNSPIQLVEQLKGYFYVNSVLAVSLAITLFSFVGIPPLVGFFAKQMVLSSAINSGYLFITFIAIITSVISAYYYLAVVKQIFFYLTNYKLNPQIDNITIKTTIIGGNYNDSIENVNLSEKDITLSSSLTTTISTLTIQLVYKSKKYSYVNSQF